MTAAYLRKPFLFVLCLASLTSIAYGQAGGTIENGTNSAPDGIMVPNFRFEPEFPLNSLKTVPIWNELEQLLDNPYNVTLCSALPASVDVVVRTTPGTTVIQGSPPPQPFPAYCTRVGATGLQRRPGFGVTLPPLIVHPLNYSPTTGEEMRLLNDSYIGGRWIVPEEIVQCGSEDADAFPAVVAICAARLNDPNVWVTPYSSVLVSPGEGRVEETAIDNNAPLRPDIANPIIRTIFSTAAANSDSPVSLGLATVLLDQTCATTTELFPAPEASITCGGDPGEPGYVGFGISPAITRPLQYSVPAIFGAGSFVGGVPVSTAPLVGSNTGGPITARLFDPTRGTIQPRNTTTGAGGLKKPSLRIPAHGGTPANPNYLANRTDTGAVATDPSELAPSNENDYIRDRTVAAALGKALFWDMQVGSDAVQSCASCHAHAAADNRVKNQMNPNHLGGDLEFEVVPVNGELTVNDFPFQKLANPNVAGDPKCTTPLVAHVDGGVLENTPDPALTGASGDAATGVTMTVCDAGNVIPNKNISPTHGVANDVASSMGVHWGVFKDIKLGFGPPSSVGGVASVLPDLRASATDCAALPLVAPTPGARTQADCLREISDPIPGFAGLGGTGEAGVNNQFRRVEPRNTPTIFAAAVNFDNFWDGRANHDFNGGSVFGASDPQSHIWVSNPVNTNIIPTRQMIRFVSLASLATGPGLSEFEMSLLGRNWAKIAKKLLQNGATPLANQLVDPNDSLLGPYSNQPGNPSPSPLCSGAALAARSVGKPGLCTSYNSLIAAAFYPRLHNNATHHLRGCYTDGRTEIHNQCGAETETVPILTSSGFLDTSNLADPFDGFKLRRVAGVANPNNTNQFTQMEANFALFWGLSINTWASLLMPDNTPFDQFMDQNQDAFEAIGEANETGLVNPMPLCTTPTQRHCVREVGNFKRDSQALAAATGSLDCNALPVNGGTTSVPTAVCYGTRNSANDPDPLLGMDIFQGSNVSLKNPNFRVARCGECHAGGTLTDNTMPFTTKAQIGDFIGEFIDAGNEALIEPLGRTRVITGFLAEDELNGNGQDAIERRIANQSLVPCPIDGLAYPGAVASGIDGVPGGLPNVDDVCNGSAQSFFDNGVYNLGVTRCEADESHVIGYCDDNGRGNTDAFGWPLSHAAKLLKNLGGLTQEPGTPLGTFDPSFDPECAPECATGGLFEETAQDQQINPGQEDEEPNPFAPGYLAKFLSHINLGDAHPDMDEVDGGLNTLTNVAMIEGFTDTLGPFNPAGVMNEATNNADGPFMGTWPVVNRVGRFGGVKAPQLREVELTGPYFHNGGKLTLRQVVDFYSRGGDFPITNATHRDFNMINQNIEVQSNLTEEEKVALVDFLLELTDERVRFERAPFDHPQVILPLDGTAPENIGRDAMLASCQTLPDGNILGPGQRSCAGGMFLDVPATGATGIPASLDPQGIGIPNFLGIKGRNPGLNGKPIKRLVGAAANCSTADSQYCH